MIELLKWSEVKPTVPGLYWHRSKNSDGQQLGQLLQVQPSQLNDRTLVAYRHQHTDDRMWCYLDALPGEWAQAEYVPNFSTSDLETLHQGLVVLMLHQLKTVEETTGILAAMDADSLTELEGVTGGQFTKIKTDAQLATMDYERISNTIRSVLGQQAGSLMAETQLLTSQAGNIFD